METTERHLTIHDVVRPEPPIQVRAATAAWFLAIGAGIAESVLGVIGAIGDGAPVLGLVAQILFRTIVYGGLLLVIDRSFRQGRRWSRPLLTVLLGVIGMATLVVGPISWLATNGDLGSVDLSWEFVAFAVIRTSHVLAVIAGVVLMYRPESNRWFNAKAA
jgi:hypothetical protein